MAEILSEEKSLLSLLLSLILLRGPTMLNLTRIKSKYSFNIYTLLFSCFLIFEMLIELIPIFNLVFMYKLYISLILSV